MNKGPSIGVDIYVDAGQITQTFLRSHSDEGLTWKIVGDGSTVEESIRKWLECYCARQNPMNELPLKRNTLSEFTESVLNKLCQIPFGQTTTYADLAFEIGKSKAARAVGGACGRNPFPLFVPCHRVLAVGYKLGGFSMGLPIKKLLLEYEGFF